ncbi:hypothetical protein QBC42DRAFT_276589 [Cladorrhinum samala]|uniref:Uncharacterized protein n=1 Tax=Cladorrhinum samala TaxID=585594 RepID=A0AAV9HE62_9PEZI|nr:hypothetical protein QBC42DRAFT_276589 [Cladorrhinum samala]
MPSKPHIHNLYLLYLLILSLSATPAAAITQYAEAPSCQIIGDPDIYGIGVRLGYYLTFFAGAIAVCSRNKRAMGETIKPINIIFCAVLIALIRNTLKGSFALLEWQITILSVWSLPTFLCVLIFTFGSARPASWAIYLLLSSIYLGLTPWLYWTRREQGQRMDCPVFKTILYLCFPISGFGGPVAV